MKKYAVTAAICLTLGACASGPQPARPFEDPAVQKLYNLPTPQYFATLQIAGQVAQNCIRYNYDAAVDAMVNAQRNEEGRGTLSARAFTAQIDAEVEIGKRSFTARHGVDIDAGVDLCPAADAETAENSAIAAVLAPVPGG